MDVLQTLEARLAEIDPAVRTQHPRTSLRNPSAATVVARPPPIAVTTERELPRISVELRGSLPGAPQTREAPTTDRAMRDLEVIRTLGEGGMGRVFLARQHSLDREVAIKTVRDGASQRERDALLSEGAITGHLEHPAIVPVHALGVEEEGRPVLVMKRVEGVEWTELLDDANHPLWRERGDGEGDRLEAHLEILTQVCNAAHFAHSRRIVHRDIKPQNVFIGRYGEVYLGDWGAAVRVDEPAQEQPLCGTPAYMAPEMVVGGVVDARTDVYLLGATLHQILTGAPRHRGKDVQSALRAALSSEPFVYDEHVPTELAALANRATARDPRDRPQSAAALREEIAAYLRHKSSIALARSAVERISKLRALLEDASNEEAQRALDQLVVEARFALRRALEEWSENEAAARASKELEELLQARRTRAIELERLARDLDPTIASRSRAVLFAALAVVGLALAISGGLAHRAVTPRSIFLESLGPDAIVALGIVALRRQLLDTALNRRVVFSLLATVVAITLSRGVGWLAGMSAGEMLVHDLVLLCALGVLGSLLLFRWIAWCIPILLAGAVVAALAPDHGIRVFSVSAGAAQLVILAFAWRRVRTPRPTSDPDRRTP